jgi:hypothetical protein
MNPAQAQNLRRLLTTQHVASLGTLHHGEPYVSMAPFALLPHGSGFVIHVSALSIRYIGGFAQASTISQATFSDLMTGAADDGEHA